MCLLYKFEVSLDIGENPCTFLKIKLIQDIQTVEYLRPKSIKCGKPEFTMPRLLKPGLGLSRKSRDYKAATLTRFGTIKDTQLLPNILLGSERKEKKYPASPPTLVLKLLLSTSLG